MTAPQRDEVAAAATSLAIVVKAGDADKFRSSAIAEYAANFGATAALLGTVSPRVAADSFEVTQVYLLDARARTAGDPADAEFTCALSGTTAETDFSIPALPPGLYSFAMVEAKGSEPWLLAFLLRQDAGVWKMAGFYPRARAAAGHDGLWYWNTARDDAKAKQLWLAWLFYGEADELLRPANFVSSTNLDKLRQEEHAATPPEVADGVSEQTPLVLKGAGGAEFRVTGVSVAGAAKGSDLNLLLHYTVDVKDAMSSDAAAARARNLAAAKALLDAHKELRQGFAGVLVFSETVGHGPFVSDLKMAEIP